MKIKENYLSKLTELGFGENKNIYYKEIFSNSSGFIKIIVYKIDWKEIGVEKRDIRIYASNDGSYKYLSGGLETYEQFDEIAPIDLIIELYKKGFIEE